MTYNVILVTNPVTWRMKCNKLYFMSNLFDWQGVNSRPSATPIEIYKITRSEPQSCMSCYQAWAIVTCSVAGCYIVDHTCTCTYTARARIYIMHQISHIICARAASSSRRARNRNCCHFYKSLRATEQTVNLRTGRTINIESYLVLESGEMYSLANINMVWYQILMLFAIFQLSG